MTSIGGSGVVGMVVFRQERKTHLHTGIIPYFTKLNVINMNKLTKRTYKAFLTEDVKSNNQIWVIPLTHG